MQICDTPQTLPVIAAAVWSPTLLYGYAVAEAVPWPSFSSVSFCHLFLYKQTAIKHNNEHCFLAPC